MGLVPRARPRGFHQTTTDDLHAIGEHSFARLVQGVRTRQYPGWAGDAVYQPDRFASMTTWRIK